MIARQRILLVDDDDDYVQIVGRAVEREHLPVEVAVARNGVDALHQLGIFSAPEPADIQPPVAVFLDLDLPGVDGLEVLRLVRADARLARLPVVMISSSSRARDVERSYDLGANSYLLKQYDPAGPGRYIARAMRYWLELNHTAEGGTSTR
jgi:two-component system response regulator